MRNLAHDLMNTRKNHFIFLLILVAGLGLLYATSLKNQLLFDDGRLTDGAIFGNYGSLFLLKARTLSYGSFVWIRSIFGESWPVQRGFNIALHIATAIGLYQLVLTLLNQTQWNEEALESEGHSQKLVVIAQVSAALWAFNPVAVYAVAYLIQRSIVMATFFVVFALLTLLWGMTRQKPIWFAVSLLCYALAIASKEYAITAVALVLPLYFFVKRPSLKIALSVTGIAVLLISILGFFIFKMFGDRIAVLFDDNFVALSKQLELLKPGIGSSLYALSVQNQASLFFQYGLTWLVPYAGWMSIDLRPAFPLYTFGSNTFGLIAFTALVLGGGWLVIKRKDGWGLLGLTLLIPTLMYATEFVTIWLQDPYVLYRSYLWSIGMPLLIGVTFASLADVISQRSIVITGIAGSLLLAALSFERIDSLSSPADAWKDAVQKIDRTAPANALGRYRPFLNLGNEYLLQGLKEEALRHYQLAEDFGEPLGAASMNKGQAQQVLRQNPQALESFNKAEAKGFTDSTLYFHRGESLFMMRQFEEAIKNFSIALEKPQLPDAKTLTLARRAESHLGLKDYPKAVADYETLIKQSSANGQRYSIGLAMAYVGNKDYAKAMDLINQSMTERPTARLYFARALTYFYQGNKVASLADVQQALKAEPNNPSYKELESKLLGGNAPVVGIKKP